jgi:hypothetical protein
MASLRYVASFKSSAGWSKSMIKLTKLRPEALEFLRELRALLRKHDVSISGNGTLPAFIGGGYDRPTGYSIHLNVEDVARHFKETGL